jgi:hypothetical protein
MTNQHPKTQTPNDLDLTRNPGIGQTTRGIDQQETIFEDEEGDNTIEGDVMNDTAGDGSIKPNHRPRINN